MAALRVGRQRRRSLLALPLVDDLERRQLLAAVTVDVGHPIRTIAPGYSGTNLAYWNYELGTSRLQQMVKDAGLKLFRMPGGSAADAFHFSSPPPYNGYDTTPVFAKAIEAMGGDAIVTVDYGSGSPQEAAAMLAYLNAPLGSSVAIGHGDTWSDSANAWVDRDWKTAGYWASLRAATPLATDDGLNFLRVGHAAAWGFGYYEVGNEEYATWEIDHHDAATNRGGQSASRYATFAAQFGALAQQIDAHVRIGVDVSPPLRWNMPNANWTRDVLSTSKANGFTPGFLSDHAYVTSLSDSNLLLHSVNDPAFKMDAYDGSWAKRAAWYRTLLNQTYGTATAAPVRVMLTEFNSDIGTKQASNLVGGLWLADSMGGLAQTEYTAGLQWDLTNGYNALATPDANHYGWREGVDEGLVSTGNANGPASGAYVPYPVYFAEQLFGKFVGSGGAIVPVAGDDPNLSTYAVKGADGHVRLLVINKSATSTLTGTFGLGGFAPAGAATQWQYGIAEDTAQRQTSDGHASLTTSSFTSGLTATGLSRAFPAYSMSVIDLAPAPVTPPVTPTQLTGTPIGTPGSIGGNTVAKAFDGSLATYVDLPGTAAASVGLDLGSARTIASVRFAPRATLARRMTGGVFQASNSATFATGVVTLGTIATQPVDGALTTMTFSNAGGYRYVRYLAPAGSFGNVAELQFFGTAGGTVTPPPTTTLTKLSGTAFGTAGSIGGNTFAKALDGDLTTYVDSTTVNGATVGLDLGSAKVVKQIRFAPRATLGRRMVGGYFQGSNFADFSVAATLFTIATAPVDGILTSVDLTNTTAYRYVRYVAPASSFGNVSEVQFYG